LVTAGLDEREARWAAGVKGTAEHLASLINLTIDSVKAGAHGLKLRQEPFRLRTLMDGVAASLAARAETKGLQSHCAIDPDLPALVIGDAARLRAALENLIDNAVKFTDSGSIKLALAATPLPRGKLRLSFAVTDTGIGLKPAEIKRLFRPFAQANESIARRYGGAGLGLVFVKRLAKAMGGDLKISAAPGGGSSFQLTVTVAGARSAAPAARGVEAQRDEACRPLKILCAEDNPFGRVVLNTILTELGHRADFVSTGQAALEAVQKGNYDLVLMDVMLAGTDGIEATRRIRALAAPVRTVPVIGISGRTAPGDEARARAAGMSDYLTKPISPGMLAVAIAAVVPK
jgi:CheY-like chemotaxis protein